MDKIEKQPLLILYSDGSIELPGAATYGNVRYRFATVIKAAEEFERQFLDMPLPRLKTEAVDEV